MATSPTSFASARGLITRHGPRAVRPRALDGTEMRPLVISRARRRLAEGFYDQPDILSAALDRMFDTARAPARTPARPDRRTSAA